MKVTLNCLPISIKFYETLYFEDFQSKNTCLKIRQSFLLLLCRATTPQGQCPTDLKLHSPVSSKAVNWSDLSLGSFPLPPLSIICWFFLSFSRALVSMGNLLFFQDNDIQSWSGYLLILLIYHLCALVAEPLLFHLVIHPCDFGKAINQQKWRHDPVRIPWLGPTAVPEVGVDGCRTKRDLERKFQAIWNH